MARRAGKAASRRARQRRAAHRPTPPAVGPAAPAPSVDMTDVEDGSAPSRDEPRSASAPVASAPSPASAYAASGSSLTARERAEYHYVERDLRNIGILTAILFALLIAAWLVFNALGLI